jgi:hypothetical protein
MHCALLTTISWKLQLGCIDGFVRLVPHCSRCLRLPFSFVPQIAKVTDKDIRKFLDGVYVSFRGNIVSEE